MDKFSTKSGVTTTEFWFALLPTVFSMLVMAGVIAPNDSSYLLGLAKEIVPGIVATVSLVVYITSRTNLKREYIKSQSGIESLPDTEQKGILESSAETKLG